MSRTGLAVGGVALFLVGLLAAVWVTRTETPVASAPPTASSPTTSASAAASTPSAGPTASPAAAGGLDERFGFIVTSGSAVWVRPENDAQRRTTLTGRFSSVSADGTQIALWRATGGTDELFVVPAARLDQERSVYKVPAGQQGVQTVWANDGSGLLFTTQRPATPGSSSGPTVTSSTLVILDLRTASSATTVATLTDGRMHLPIAWDRSNNLAAAGESSVTSSSPRAPVMETYLTLKTSGTLDVTRRPVTDGFATIVGSSDAKYVYARAADSIRYWPLADYSAGASFTATGLTGKLLWRPGTTQIAWLAGQQLDAYDVGTKSTVTLFRGITRNSATGTDLQLFRADGSAAVVGPVSIGPGVVAPMTLVVLGSGTAVQFHTADAIGSGFMASVRLR